MSFLPDRSHSSTAPLSFHNALTCKLLQDITAVPDTLFKRITSCTSFTSFSKFNVLYVVSGLEVVCYKFFLLTCFIVFSVI